MDDAGITVAAHKPITHLVVTGSTGVLGAAILRQAAPSFTVIEIKSAKRGGVDLREGDAWKELITDVVVPSPECTAVIHCAADISWSGSQVLENNFLMARNVARWTAEAGIAFAVYVSSVSVFQPAEHVSLETPCLPATLYGMSKLRGEHAWRSILDEKKSAIVRLAGILGWQPSPQMFWNKLLVIAAERQAHCGFDYNPESQRNYITSSEAAECLLGIVTGRHAGLHLAAGAEATLLAAFIAILEAAAGSSIAGRVKDSARDVVLYEPSPVLRRWLRPFHDRFHELWQQRMGRTLL